MALTTDLARAYACMGDTWARGPMQVYGHLAMALLTECPSGVAGRRVLDLGAGTGAFSRAARAGGAADVVAVDVAGSMLRCIPNELKVAAVIADAYRLPFAAGSFDVVGAAFSLNHLEEPAAALVEARRVLAAGGVLVVSAYARDDDHVAKGAAEAAAVAHGWRPAPWYDTFRHGTMPKLATEAGAAAEAGAAGLDGAVARRRLVTIAGLSPRDLVAWRLGLVQYAPWLQSLDAAERAAVARDALDRLGTDPPPLVRSMITLTWSKNSA
jgi:ubiquinone/menaquinone biosynthesis C-methylase UbiE